MQQENELRIMRKLIKALLAQKEVKLSDVKRIVGHISAEIGEKNEDVAAVLGPLFIEAATETFNLENFKKGTR
jgi:hypothetical protein